MILMTDGNDLPSPENRVVWNRDGTSWIRIRVALYPSPLAQRFGNAGGQSMVDISRYV